MNRAEWILVILMRTVGVGGLLAIPAILFPYSWMNRIHEFLGLGTLPDAPIVSYLTRSLSMFYAFVGALTLYVSFNIRRYREFVRLWAMILTVVSLVQLGIDLVSGMPMFWTYSEGPPMTMLGLALMGLQRGIQAQPLDVDS